MLLQRPEKYGKNKSTIKDIRAVFSPRTYSQFSLAWKTYFQELRSIDAAKKTFMKNNCFDIERVYFELDRPRKGYFDRSDLKVYMMENGVRLGKVHENEIDLLISFFDRTGTGQVKFDNFVDEFL